MKVGDSGGQPQEQPMVVRRRLGPGGATKGGHQADRHRGDRKRPGTAHSVSAKYWIEAPAGSGEGAALQDCRDLPPHVKQRRDGADDERGAPVVVNAASVAELAAAAVADAWAQTRRAGGGNLNLGIFRHAADARLVDDDRELSRAPSQEILRELVGDRAATAVRHVLARPTTEAIGAPTMVVRQRLRPSDGG